ncbi:MAG: PASTA domain-containing protein [Chitinophagales bacterium]
MKFIKFLTTKYFWVSLLMMVLVALIFFLALMGYLRGYTDHGKSITVPDLKEMSLKQAQETLKSKNLRFAILDSASYFPDLPPQSVIAHSPKADQKVKKNRKIYLEVNRSTPPLVVFPEWKDYPNKRTIIDKIESLGLKVGKITRVTCSGSIDYTDDNFVEDIKYDGKSVTEGTEIPKGEKVDILLCDGFGSTGRIVPDILGMTLLEAQLVLESHDLTIGRIKAQGIISDSLSAFVYYQSPPHDGFTKMRIGEAVDLYITQTKVDIN